MIEIKKNTHIYPRFLSELSWNDSSSKNIEEVCKC